MKTRNEVLITQKAPPVIVMGAKKKDRSHRPALVLNSTSDLKIMKHKMEEAEKDNPVMDAGTKRRGRPFGSKNKPQAVLPPIEIPQDLLNATLTANGKRRGRPFGSKNKDKGVPFVAPALVAILESDSNAAVRRGRKPKAVMLSGKPAVSVRLDEYAVFYAEKGLDDYKTLIAFMQTNSVPVKQAIGLLSGAISTPKEDALVAFKLGNFRVKNLEHAQKAVGLRTLYRETAPDIYFKASFTNALARVTAMPNFNERQLEKNMKKSFMGVEKADTAEAYERQLVEIYNTNLAKKDRLLLQD